MAVTAGIPPDPSAVGAPRWGQHVLELLSAIWSIESVRKLAFSSNGAQFDLWVVQQEEALEDTDRISLLDRAFRLVASDVPLEYHVVSLDHVEEENLPPAETLFAR